MDLWIWVHFFLLVDVRQVSVISFPVAFQVEPVLSFVVRVGSLLEPPAEFEQREESFNMITVLFLILLFLSFLSSLSLLVSESYHKCMTTMKNQVSYALWETRTSQNTDRLHNTILPRSKPIIQYRASASSWLPESWQTDSCSCAFCPEEGGVV